MTQCTWNRLRHQSGHSYPSFSSSQRPLLPGQRHRANRPSGDTFQSPISTWAASNGRRLCPLGTSSHGLPLRPHRQIPTIQSLLRKRPNPGQMLSCKGNVPFSRPSAQPRRGTHLLPQLVFAGRPALRPPDRGNGLGRSCHLRRIRLDAALAVQFLILFPAKAIKLF